MAKRSTITKTIRLDRVTAERLTDIAEIAGRSIDDVIVVILALAVYHQRIVAPR